MVESDGHQFRNTVPRVLRHLDLITIESISESIAESIDTQGMRFAAVQAFLVRSTLDPSARPLSHEEEVGQELASAYLLEYPGKLASLVGPWVAPGRLSRSYPGAATEVLSTLVDLARFWGVELVQAVIDDDSPFATESLRDAGLSRLSTLHQMAVDLPAVGVPVAKASEVTGVSLEWKRYASVDEAVWIDWMDATYEQTADCPELNGLRTTSKTLEGYLASAGTKSNGANCPEWWGGFPSEQSTTEMGGQGRIVSAFMLSNSGGGFWELSYMGVAPSHRGQGLGNETLCRALVRARDLNARRLTLAVDCRNSFAIRLYRAHGFQRVRQLEAWFLAFRN